MNQSSDFDEAIVDDKSHAGPESLGADRYGWIIRYRKVSYADYRFLGKKIG